MKQWRIYQTFYKDQHKLANRASWISTNNKKTDLTNCENAVSINNNKKGDALTKKKKKQKSNVFKRIIWSIFDIVETMWRQKNKDRHCHENGKIMSTTVKPNRTVKGLYVMCELVMSDDIDTYFDVDINTHLNDSLCSKWGWIERWKNCIYASVKRAKQDA